MNNLFNQINLRIKVILSVTAFLVVALILSLFSVNAAQTYLLGDVNKDGFISIRDATIIQMYLAKYASIVNSMDNTSLICADVNEDGNVNIMDVTIIQKHKIGIDTNTRINQYIKLVEPTTQLATDNQWLPGFFD